MFGETIKNGFFCVNLRLLLGLYIFFIHTAYAYQQPRDSDYIPIRVLPEEDLATALEPYRDQKVKIDFDSDLVVTQPFSFDFMTRSDKLVLSLRQPLVASTQLFMYPSAAERAHRIQNHHNKLYIETHQKTRNKGIPYYSLFEPNIHYIRVGDRISGLFGTLKYDNFAYRLILDDEVSLSAHNFLHVKDRQPPPIKQQVSNLRIVSFNLQNYFVSAEPMNGDLNPHCATRADANKRGRCNRGAKTQQEFVRQQTKLINTITQLDPDLIGLTELENNGFGDKSAIYFFTKALNDKTDAIDKKYQFIEIAGPDRYQDKFFGSGPITVGILYRPDKVQPIHEATVLKMPIQDAEQWDDGRSYHVMQRDTLVQKFRTRDTTFNFAVNHFKSKIADCIEDKESSYKARVIGGCNNLRVASSQVLGEFVATQSVPTLVVGDLNSHAQEDPIRLLTSNKETFNAPMFTAKSIQMGGQKLLLPKTITSGFGLVNFMDPKVDFSHSYAGELGNLDYILGSKELAAHVVQAYAWHINSHESPKFSYIQKISQGVPKSLDPVRSSDHDPLVIDFNFSG